MYRGPAHQGTAKRCARPNYAEVSKQLARRGVTRRLLWSEYRDQHAIGIGCSVFCDELSANYRGEPGQRIARALQAPGAASEEDRCWAADTLFMAMSQLAPSNAVAMARIMWAPNG